ncbi:MAG: Hydrogenase, Fe-only [Caldanaerobacter subterraneus]|jgi:NADP-reducing hydrogenase subunit HndD|uniref:Ferredoxin n=3 Tax=Caldanaerobacter subterraneus TaxID=911092 RepID=A0A124FCQ1_9THEO|nr:MULTISPECIES: NADH-dependent [FeFe] hydrogenase, group A6 [Caldanaerobacter]ERM93010.1 ferredoxin [Caldanaerobacter subterraneus subsp. yonseiensis KB-1]KKC30074.1 Fe-only hydrogenase subunit HydA [Caldanaerobacter subterraneus subsp. pacificus DSM 12653]KUK09351.1 MAG: Hydrogenase, Fe-only [Caldanaerobacter subterraneus]MBE3579835.1 iron hydrogenase small subunit [Caldanaerobacter subterraneus]MDI3518645.1 NADP-reducing hydrogenase subunit HndD [Caldanaerobacter sp.]
MDKVRVTIDGITVEVPSYYTVLEAAKEAGIDIPTLCYLKEINQIGACRICLVEIEGVRNLQTSCTYPVFDGMKVYTNTPKIREARRLNLELILSNHDRNCLTCVRSTNCELQALAKRLGVEEIRFEGENIRYPIDDGSPAVVRDPNKCVLCRRCVAVCSEVQNVFAIGMVNRGFKTMVAPSFGRSLKDSPCISCGQCIMVCPVGAIYEKDHTKRVYEALADDKKYVVAQTAPAVRVALGEEFGMPVGTIVTGKMAAALRRMGFDAVFDTNFAADLTIMEEGSELLERIKHGGKLPMITSCSPGWIAFCEKYYPEFIDNLSTCKSPHMMMGALVKSYYAEKKGLDPKDIFVVSIMPCTAKKLEIEREEMIRNGMKDVDAVLTTRELARMIKEMGIDFVNLKDEEFDEPLGMSTGAGAIFGATGGVMEAALRTVAEIVEGRDIGKIDFEEVRGLEGVREATITIDGMDIKIAIANGTGNAKKLLDKVKAGEVEYHFIEVMGCPGGCIMGGGQPIHNPNEMEEVKKLRAKAIYEIDKNLPIRKSHENPAIKRLYEEFLGHPLSEKSHELLHTHYSRKELYPLVK